MDLHVVGPAATPEERAAIDAFLDPLIGPARRLGRRRARVEVDGRVARGGHEARARRDLLLPTLHAIQDRIGWISQGALNHACRRLTVPPADAYGVATLLRAPVHRAPAPRRWSTSATTGLPPRGRGAICADLERELGPAGHPRDGSGATWLRSPCLGQCERAPTALLTLAGDPPARIATGPLRDAGPPRAPAWSPRLLIGARSRATSPPGPVLDCLAAILGRSVPQAGDPGLRLLSRVGRADPASLADFLVAADPSPCGTPSRWARSGRRGARHR